MTPNEYLGAWPLINLSDFGMSYKFGAENVKKKLFLTIFNFLSVVKDHCIYIFDNNKSDHTFMKQICGDEEWRVLFENIVT